METKTNYSKNEVLCILNELKDWIMFMQGGGCSDYNGLAKEVAARIQEEIDRVLGIQNA